MDKEKEIEELASALYAQWRKEDFWVDKADFTKIAEMIIMAGYRKVSEALKEATEEIDRLNCIIADLSETIKEYEIELARR